VGSDYAKEYTVIDSLGGIVFIDNMEYVELYRASKNGSFVIGAVREDTVLNKIHFHNFSKEIVLYDFNLDIGDTIYY